MKHKMEKLMEKKKGKKLSDNEVKAKSSVLQELSDTAAGMMKEKLGGLKKATIMAPDAEGMKKGAKLVEKIAGAMPNGEESEEKSGMEEAKEQESQLVADAEDGGGMHMGEESEEAEEEGEEKSKEELLAELAELKAKIEKMS